MLGLAIGLAVVAGYILLHQWGMQPVVECLRDMRTFNASVVLLVRRGVHGTALRIEWPDSGTVLLVEKRIDEKQGISLLVRDQTESAGGVEVAHRIAVEEFVGDRLPAAYTGASVREVRHALEAAAAAHSQDLLRGAMISYQGRVLGFNIPERSGVPNDGRLSV